MKMKRVPATQTTEACRQAMLAAMHPYADELGPRGMLAVASAVVGQLIAMQDQRTTTIEMAMQIVARNIEAANQEVVRSIASGPVAGRA